MSTFSVNLAILKGTYRSASAKTNFLSLRSRNTMPCSWQLFTTSHIWRNRRFASGSLRRLRTRTYECRSPWNKHDNLQSIWNLNAYEWMKQTGSNSHIACHRAFEMNVTCCSFNPNCNKKTHTHAHAHANKHNTNKKNQLAFLRMWCVNLAYLWRGEE